MQKPCRDDFMGRGSRDREATSITSIGITFCESNTRCIDATNEGTRDEGHSSLKFEGRSQTHNGEDIVDETKVGGASLHLYTYMYLSPQHDQYLLLLLEAQRRVLGLEGVSLS